MLGVYFLLKKFFMFDQFKIGMMCVFEVLVKILFGLYICGCDFVVVSCFVVCFVFFFLLFQFVIKLGD